MEELDTISRSQHPISQAWQSCVTGSGPGNDLAKATLIVMGKMVKMDRPPPRSRPPLPRPESFKLGQAAAITEIYVTLVTPSRSMIGEDVISPWSPDTMLPQER
jgi:hypothetical protein